MAFLSFRDQRACAEFGEEFQQHRVRRGAVEDDHAFDATLQRFDTGLDLRDHATGDHAGFDQAPCLADCEFLYQSAVAIEDAGHVCQEEKAGRVQCTRDSASECVGIDVSEAVLARARNYLEEIHQVCGLELNVTLMVKDLYDVDLSEMGGLFDLVFNFGVIEHILDDSARLRFLEKKYALTREGGYIVSIVPNGSHPLRNKMRQYNLGGYNIPEIDYNEHLMAEEFKAVGAKDITILAHNLFSYLLIENKNLFIDSLKKLSYLGMQAVPWSLLPPAFAYRQAGDLIGIARK